jgi:YesN/AraC family two-component response regulator
MIRVLIADDEKFIRQGIRHTVPWEKNGMAVVGEASDGEEAIKFALELRPDIVLLDINMPVKNGIEVAKELNKIAPDIRIVFLTAYDTQENLKAAINMKTSAFILKSAIHRKF